jgi:membrane-associated phospholipid phosphatase
MSIPSESPAIDRDRAVPAPAWQAQIALRLGRLFLLKLVGTSAMIGVFFVAYFHLLRYPVHAVTVMPLTALDAIVPFQPSMLVPYLSLWLYVGLAPGLELTVKALLAYAAWAGALCVTGLLIFQVWPTAVPALDRMAVDGQPGFGMLQGLDAAGNACPSMHVAFAVFSAFRLEHVLKTVGVPGALRWANLAWVLAIAWSTVAIRQHVVLDVLAGALLGALFAGLSLRREAGR